MYQRCFEVVLRTHRVLKELSQPLKEDRNGQKILTCKKINNI